MHNIYDEVFESGDTHNIGPYHKLSNFFSAVTYTQNRFTGQNRLQKNALLIKGNKCNMKRLRSNAYLGGVSYVINFI